MAIRKMEFAKGEELNIRSFPRVENKVIFENINELMENGEQFIVKCGKSFWDVTGKPEIFKQSEEFDPHELTSIEKKEMQQTAPHAHAYEEKSDVVDPMKLLYQKTEEEEEEPEYVVRKTYYLTELIVEIIEAYRYANKLEVSETVRELIMRGAPDDILEEAKKRLAMHRKHPEEKQKTRKKKKRVHI